MFGHYREKYLVLVSLLFSKIVPERKTILQGLKLKVKPFQGLSVILELKCYYTSAINSGNTCQHITDLENNTSSTKIQIPSVPQTS